MYRPRQSSDGGALILLLLLVMLPMMAATGYVGFKKYKGEDPFDFLKNGNFEVPTFQFETVNGVPVFTAIEPSDCGGTEYVKKRSCHSQATGRLLDGSEGFCGDGVEEWVLDPNAPGYEAAKGTGKCESDFRPCNVPCDKPCEGNTWTPGACMRNGVVLDGSEDKCGQGMLTNTLDETAPDYKPAQGKGTCTKNYGSACFVDCPVNVVPPKVCVYQTNWVDTNKCVKTKDDRADEVGYDEAGWNLWFKLALEAENCEGEDRLIEWKTCTGPPAPVDCVGTWTTDDNPDPDGWGPCVGACGTQSSQSRTYRVKTEAKNGGAACPYADKETESRVCTNVPVQPCCVMGDWTPGTCRSDGWETQTRTSDEKSPGACSGQDKEREKRCCYEKEDWTAVGSCGSYKTGELKYKQTTVGNCSPGTDTKYEPCVNCVQKGQISDKKYCTQYYPGGPSYLAHATRRVTITPASNGGIECLPEYTFSGKASWSETEPERQACSNAGELQAEMIAGYPGATWSDCSSKFCTIEMYHRKNK